MMVMTAMKVCLVVFACAASLAAAGCACPAADVALVLDTSGSVSQSELNLMKQGINHIFKRLPKSQFAFTESYVKDPTKSTAGFFALRDFFNGDTSPSVIPTEAQLPTLGFKPSAEVRALLPKSPHQSATDLFWGMRVAAKSLRNRKTPNKICIVLFDGAHNIMTAPTLEDSLDKVTGVSVLEEIVKNAQAEGVRFYFLGIATEAYRKTSNTKATDCLRAAKKCNMLDKFPETPTADVEKCLQPGAFFARANSRPIWQAFKEGDKDARAKVGEFCMMAHKFHKDQAAQITFLNEHLSDTLQYQESSSWEQLELKSSALAREVCAGMGYTVHFNSAKSTLPCTNSFFNCAQEPASLLTDLSCCRGKDVFCGAHTSAAGNKAYNQKLAVSRGQTVFQHLRTGSSAVPPFNQAIHVSAFGEDALASSRDSGNEGTLAAASNRRVVCYCGNPPLSAGVWDARRAVVHPPVVATTTETAGTPTNAAPNALQPTPQAQ